MSTKQVLATATGQLVSKEKVVQSSQLNIDKFRDYYSNCFNSNDTATTKSHFIKQNEVSE